MADSSTPPIQFLARTPTGRATIPAVTHETVLESLKSVNIPRQQWTRPVVLPHFDTREEL